MNTPRTQLQKITLLTCLLILVLAVNGFAQEITLDGSGRVDGKGGDDFEGQSNVSDLDQTTPGNERWFSDFNIIISWSKSNDELRGFSKTSGEWTPLKIPKQTAIQPITNRNSAAVRVDDTMAAYSGITGTWDVLKLSNDNKSSVDVSDPAVICITENGMLYTFAAANGKWTSPDDPNFRRSRQLSDLPDDLIDQQALELARRFREKSLNPTQVRSRISKAVAASFDQRQTYQKAEAARMEQKLKSIQAAITKRETLRERIIARRVDELLNLKLDRVPQSPATSADR